MRLFWAFVVVGVVCGVTGEEEKKQLRSENIPKLSTEKRKLSDEPGKNCADKEDFLLCLEGFLFTTTALTKVRNNGELEVVLSLEKSLHPQVTFNVSLHKYADEDVGQREWQKDKVLAREEVILEVNELRRVVLQVSDLQWNTAYLVVRPHPTGHPQIEDHMPLTFTEISRVNSEVDVFLQTEKEDFATGEIVDFRAVVVDEKVEKKQKFAQVIATNYFGYDETRLPWVEVPETGIVRGNFTFGHFNGVKMRVTSNVNSVELPVSTSPKISISKRRENSDDKLLLSAKFEGLSDVYFSQPRAKGRVTLTSSDGFPLEGHCNVTIEPDWFEGIEFTRRLLKKSLVVGVAGGEFEFDVVDELGVRKDAGESVRLRLTAECSHRLLGSAKDADKAITFWRSLFRVTLLSEETETTKTLPWSENLPEKETTAVLKFLVERRDGGSVEEEEPTKGLQVGLPICGTKFSLPIPSNGRVRLEFRTNDTDSIIFLEVGVAEEEPSQPEGLVYGLLPDIHVTPVDPAQLIRRGDVVRFRVRSCLSYDNVNAILSSSKTIFSSRKFSFAPNEEEGMLDEVIELHVPQNVTEGPLLLTVYGLSSIKGRIDKKGDITSVSLNLVSSHGPQFIKIVDQNNVDMSTIVTFELKGVLADSAVSLQAAKLKSTEGNAEVRLRCHKSGYLNNHYDYKMRIQDESLGAVDPQDIDITDNFLDRSGRRPFDRRPSLVFLDVDGKTSTDHNGTLFVTKVFDRLTDFGTYVVSGATFNSKSGRTVFSNSPVLKILPSSVTLSVYVPPSAVLGETVEVFGNVRNNLATLFKGQVTLESSEGGLTEVSEELVEIQPNSFKILKMQVTPLKIGDLVVSLRSNISSLLTATKKMNVNSPNQDL